jgi:plastocyanin
MRRCGRMRWSLSLVVGGLVGCFSDRPATGPEPPGTGGPTVEIEDFAFVPTALSVQTGTTVTWTNHDPDAHTVTSDDDTSFDSGPFGQGATFEFTAGPPGTYTYFCSIHPFMRATLTVTP